MVCIIIFICVFFSVSSLYFFDYSSSTRTRTRPIGLIVLLGSGIHTVWAFWQVYESIPLTYSSVIERDLLMIGSWYISTIIGTAIAAVLVANWSKKRLYVSWNCMHMMDLWIENDTRELVNLCQTMASRLKTIGTEKYKKNQNLASSLGMSGTGVLALE